MAGAALCALALPLQVHAQAVTSAVPATEGSGQSTVRVNARTVCDDYSVNKIIGASELPVSLHHTPRSVSVMTLQQI